MRSLQLLLLAILFSITAKGQKQLENEGAYLAKNGKITHLILLTQNYLSYVTYQENKYISTWGGPVTVDNDYIKVTVEYNDQNPNEVGSIKTLAAKISKTSLQMNDLIYHRFVAKAQSLDGLWRITARQQDGKLSEIQVGDRKTIKILVDGYFQWIAINPAEKGFYGTGGGKYTFEKGQYIEQIMFFSRDNSRVGAKLSFKGERKDHQWHHSGLSSKGDPIYEVWTLESAL